MDGDLVAQLVRVDMMHNAARTNISGGAPMYIHAISVGKGMFKALSCPPSAAPKVILAAVTRLPSRVLPDVPLETSCMRLL